MQLVEPTACTPAAGWEKGQVENQAGLMRERFFTPRLRFASYEELSDWLLDDASNAPALMVTPSCVSGPSPVLVKKPGALRNVAPFRQLALPPGLERLRNRLKESGDGDRQMVKILTAITVDGLDAVEHAAAEALADGVASADVMPNILPGPDPRRWTLRLLSNDALDLPRKSGEFP